MFFLKLVLCKDGKEILDEVFTEEREEEKEEKEEEMLKVLLLGEGKMRRHLEWNRVVLEGFFFFMHKV